jgi:hypothetical protein
MTYEALLKAAGELAPDERIRLAREILGTAHPQDARPRRATLSQAVGLIRGDGVPPSDDEVQRWLEEGRLEKYGA